MKTKKFNTKLGLNKETISNLDSNELNRILGGGPTLNIRLCATNVEACETTSCWNTDLICTCTCGSLPSFATC